MSTSDERYNKEIDTRIGNTSAVLREIYLTAVTKRELSKMEVCQFLNRPFLISTCGHESWLITGRILSQVLAAEWMFAKSSRCGTSRQSTQMLISKILGCSGISPRHREKPGTLVLPCVQNVLGKIGNQTPAGYTHGKVAQRSFSKDQVA